MRDVLYFVCPTDCIEPIINETFKTNNFFFTSLGNSIDMNWSVIEKVKSMIDEMNISDIRFVLSDQNQIVLDAIQCQKFAGIRGLQSMYLKMHDSRSDLMAFNKTGKYNYILLSHHLNSQINILKRELDYCQYEPIQVSGRLYNKEENLFYNISSEIVCSGHYSLN